LFFQEQSSTYIKFATHKKHNLCLKFSQLNKKKLEQGNV